LSLDGRDFSGAYLLVEVLNTPTIGPLLKLAPKAHASDGYFDVVLISPAQRAQLAQHLAAHLNRRKLSPMFTVKRARHVRFSCSSQELHVDDKCWPEPKLATRSCLRRRATVELHLFPSALEFLVPQ
jgi:diacylglycerol kinase family enzyme